MKKQRNNQATFLVTPAKNTVEKRTINAKIKPSKQQNHHQFLCRPNLIKYWVGLSCILLGANTYAQEANT